MSAELKIVVVGDKGVGKTNLCLSYAKNEFRKEYVQTVFGKLDIHQSSYIK